MSLVYGEMTKQDGHVKTYLLLSIFTVFGVLQIMSKPLMFFISSEVVIIAIMSPRYGYILIVVSLIHYVAAQDLVHIPDAQTENSEENTVKVNQNHGG